MSVENELNQEPAVEVIEDEQGEETYHSPNKLIRISTWANTISWIVLGFTVLLFGFHAYTDGDQIVQAYQQSGGQLPWVQVAVFVLDRLNTSLFSGVFFFIALQGVSEGLNILLDIFEGQQAN